MIAADMTFAAADNAGYQLVAYFDRLARRIRFDVFTEVNDFTRTFMSERNGYNPEGIDLPLVYVRTANAAAFNLNEDILDELVLKNEPHLALFADNEGLVFYERILKESKEKNKNLKMIIFEIGYMQAKSLQALQEKYYPLGEFEVIKDYSGKDRVVIIKL